MAKKIIGLVVALIIGFVLGFPSGYLMAPSVEPHQNQMDKLQGQTTQKSNEIQMLQQQVNNLTNQLTLRDDAISELQEQISNLTDQNRILQERINNLTTQLEIYESKAKLPEFNIFDVEYSYSSATFFFELESLQFSIQNIGEGTATDVAISVVWVIRDIDIGWVEINFGITNNVVDALNWYNLVVEDFGEDSVYAKDALNRLERAINDDRELKPNEIKTYMLTIPEDVNNRDSLPSHVVEIGNVTFVVSCTEGVTETFVFD